MSYTPTAWKTGDVVTSAKLNKLEQGVASAGGNLAVGHTEEGITTTLDKTGQEILDAIQAGKTVVLVFDYFESDGEVEVYTCNAVDFEDSTYSFYFARKLGEMAFTASALTDYPSFTPGGGGTT